MDVPGASPSALVVEMGKNGAVYLLDRCVISGLSDLETRLDSSAPRTLQSSEI